MESLFAILGTLCCSLLLTATAAAAQDNRLTTTVVFQAPAGSTTTNGDGIFYSTGGWEDKVNPEAYWGTFPLYLQGTTMNFTVTLTNAVAKGNKTFKLKVRAISNVLEVDGGLGVEIGTSQTWRVVDLQPGQSQTVTGTVVIPNSGIPSGLDVTRILISHLNNDPNVDDTPAGLFDVEYCLWCPPAPPVAAN